MSRNPRRVPDRIQDMLEAIDNVKSDVQGMDGEAFIADGKTQRAVIESLIVIGEAAKKVMQLDPTIQQAAPALWQHCRDAWDMRIILTHEYFRVDAAIVWTTVRQSLPMLEAQLLDYTLNATPPTLPPP